MTQGIGATEPPVRGTAHQIVRTTLKVDWTLVEAAPALRCTIGVAIPLLLGVTIHHPSIGVFGAVGAVSVGFGSYQGAYRSRAAVMLYATAGMALSIFVGSLAGHSTPWTITVTALWGFAGGLLVALGPAASFVGLQSVVAVLIAGGFAANLREAAGRAALVFAGGLVQTLLVAMIWPLRRFSAERKSLAAVYRSLASFAAAIPSADAVAPEPHTLAGTLSPLQDPQPFAKAGDVLVFQSLLDEAERIRASLAGLATKHRRLTETNQACALTVASRSAQALAEIAAALEDGREPQEPAGLWKSFDECAARLAPSTETDALLGQIRSAWRTSGILSGAPADDLPIRPHVAPLRRRPPVADAWTTLRANLTINSTACRHALRLAVTLAIATAFERVLAVPRGYWVPLTTALVLRPDFHDTFARGAARIAGTLLGAGGATIINQLIHPGPMALTALVLGFVWAGYALVRASYALFTVCITGYVVFLLMLAGIPELSAATYRVVYTIAGGALALGAYAVWPTWAANEVRPALAGILDAHSRFVDALLNAYRDPESANLRRLDEIRSEARLTRSNGEAVVERMLTEPQGRRAMDARVAVGIVAAIRRHALAGLALRAGLERKPRAVPGIDVLAREMKESLHALAQSVREGTSPPPLPPLRQTQLALAAASDDLVRDETDLMVDSVKTMAELLLRDPPPIAGVRS
ncbi:MAG: FUSC family protein [Acidobacteriota bacterium]